MKKEYTQTFEFGKVAYSGKNKKNLVRLDVTLKIDGKKTVFTASGEVWQSNMKDIVRGGQCIDDIYNEYKGQITNRTTYEQIMTLWEKYHLNDMHAECIHQEKRGETYQINPGAECPQCGWKLGHGWSYRPIDRKDLVIILRLLNVPLSKYPSIIKLGV